MGRVRDTNGLHLESCLARSPGSQAIPREERLELLSILPMNTNQNNKAHRAVTKETKKINTRTAYLVSKSS